MKQNRDYRLGKTGFTRFSNLSPGDHNSAYGGSNPPQPIRTRIEDNTVDLDTPELLMEKKEMLKEALRILHKKVQTRPFVQWFMDYINGNSWNELAKLHNQPRDLVRNRVTACVLVLRQTMQRRA